MKCPNGYLFNYDFDEHPACKVDCPSEIYKECRKVNKTCGFKVQFRDETVARYEARRLGLTIYQCPFCECWHMSKKVDIEEENNSWITNPDRSGGQYTQEEIERSTQWR